MKLFKFTVIEHEVVTWSAETSSEPKIDDFFYTNYDSTIQACFDKTVDFKIKMVKSDSGSFNELIWNLKKDLNEILANNEFIGLRYEEDHAEINITLYDKTSQDNENTEFYRTRVRQYSNFFNKRITEQEIENIHPLQPTKTNPAEKCFSIQLREKQKDQDQFSFLEFNRTGDQPSTTVTALAFQLPVVYESISMDKPSDAMVTIQFLTIKDNYWVPMRISNRKREALRFFLRESLDEHNFRRNAFAQKDIWIQNRTSIRPIGDLNEKYTIQLRRMKILKKSKFVQDGHFIFPMGKTTNQQSQLCAHEFALVLKIADGKKFDEPKFNFYI